MRFVLPTFLSILISCSPIPKKIDGNLDITIKDAQSYEYDLTHQTYTVFRILKPDTTVHFDLSANERERIINKYYALELDLLEGKQTIEDHCMIMPKLYTTLEVNSQKGLQQITIDEGCDDFDIISANRGRRIQLFLTFVKKILDSKSQILNAPKTDIMYL